MILLAATDAELAELTQARLHADETAGTDEFRFACRLIGRYPGQSVRPRPYFNERNDMPNALMIAAESSVLSLKRIGELMGDHEKQHDGSPGGPFADRLLQYAHEGRGANEACCASRANQPSGRCIACA